MTFRHAAGSHKASNLAQCFGKRSQTGIDDGTESVRMVRLEDSEELQH